MPQDQDKNEILSAFGLAPRVKGQEKVAPKNVILDAFFQEPPADVVPSKKVSTAPIPVPERIPTPPVDQQIQPPEKKPFVKPTREEVEAKFEKSFGKPSTLDILKGTIKSAFGLGRQVTPFTVGEFKDFPGIKENLREPFARVSKVLPDVKIEGFTGATYGALQGTLDIAEGLMTPEMIGVIGGFALSPAENVTRVVEAVFSGQMLKEVPHLVKDFWSSVQEGDEQMAGRKFVHLVGNTALGVLLGKKALGIKRKPITVKPFKPTEDILPKTPMPEKLTTTVKEGIEAAEITKPVPEAPKAKAEPIKQPTAEKELVLERQIKDIGGIKKEDLAEFGITLKDNVSLYKQTVGKRGADDVAKSLGFDAARDLIDKVKGERQGRQKPAEKVPTPAKGEEVIRADDLKVGDKFTVEGEEFIVDAKSKSAVKLIDGTPMQINPDGTIVFDKGSLQRKTPTTRIEKTAAGEQITPDVLRPQRQIPKKPIEVKKDLSKETGMFAKPKPKEKTIDLPFIEGEIKPKIPEKPKVVGTKEVTTVKGETGKVKESENLYFVDPAVIEVGEKLTSIQKAITGQPTSEINAFAREAVTVRTGALRKEQFKTKRFVDKGNKEFTEAELEDMIFEREKTGNVFIKGDTHADVSSRLSPQAKQFVKLVGQRFDKMRQKVNDSGWSQEVAWVDNYITHLYTGKKLRKVSGDLARKWVTKNPFVNQRTYETFQAAIQKAGLIPRYKRVTDYIQYYENMSNLVIANNRLIKTLRAEKLPDGNELIMREGVAPTDYVHINHIAFQRVFVTKEGQAVHFRMKVHPDIEGPLRRIFDEGLRFDGAFGSILNNYRIINALSKQTMLTFSFFHHLALGESGIASGRNPITAYKKGAEYIKSEQITGKAIESGLQLNATSDVHRLVLDRMLINWEQRARGIPGLQQTTTAMRWSKQKWDSFLWDKIHSYLKLEAWYRVYTKDLIKHGDSIPEKVIARDAASKINDAFGGQNWEAMFRSSKKLEQTAHLMFLAPDWSLSNIKIAARGIGAVTKFATLGKVQLGRPTQINFAGWYWLRAASMFVLGQNAAQWLLLKSFGEDPHFTWQNDPGHKFSVELPWKDDKGRKRYIKPLKQAREVIRYITNPIEIIGNKVAPNVRILIEQFTSHSPGSGFKQPFADMEFWESIPTRIKHSIFMVTPLSVKSGGKITLPFPLDKSGQNFLFALPGSTGMNNYKTTKYFSNTLRAWAEKERKITKLGRPLSENEVIDSLKEIIRASNENNLDTKRLLSLSLSQLRTTYYGEFFSALNRDKMEEAEKWAEALTRLNATNRNMNTAVKNRFEKILRESSDLSPQEITKKRKKAQEIFRAKRKKTAVETFIDSVK